MIIEICCDSLATARASVKEGARRVELCSALSEGGLTPSIGLIQQCAAVKGLDTYVMIRPRGGGFVYTEEEVDIMGRDIEAAANAGAHGVAFGLLTKEGNIDIPSVTQLTTLSKQLGLGVTFHRAFDFTNSPLLAIEQLIDLGIDNLLTSGAEETALKGIDLIQKMTQKADGRINIMAGSGVNGNNITHFTDIGLNAIHFTAHIHKEEVAMGMGYASIPDIDKIRSVVRAIHT